ncbi:hypothetical protein [Agarivorans gilvus]|jgi:hypothetical protein|uniref:YdgH/BhsA/McbA-like domain-containing protein n=1 Tax=Agarivorans gilvus TaxID=680279 RepID=A0ABQ1I2B3_9ALTE|nr:hypothetical protein [Agarivorans gilvus]GGB09392.1 hypothetical protein GCM10007414_23470 [Agarivorans gilvus]
MKPTHLMPYALVCLLLFNASVIAAEAPLQQVSYSEASEMKLSKIGQKTFLDRYSIELAQQAAVEWAATQGASHYSVYTIERSSLRSRFRVSIILYRH